MSHDGFRPGEGNSQGGGNRSAANLDAWGHPIKQPVEVKDKDGNVIPNGGDNGGIDDKDIENIWSDIVNKKGKEGNEPPPVTTAVPAAPAVSPADQLKNYLAENGLGEFTLSDADKAQLAEGNYDVITQRTLQLVQNAHTKALSGASTLIKSEVEKAVKAAVGESKAYVEGKASLEALHAAIPATKDPAIGPVAQTVMQRFLDRGLTKEQAIKGTEQWFKHTAAKMGWSTEVNSNRNGSFRGGQNEGSGEQNWLNILSPRS